MVKELIPFPRFRNYKYKPMINILLAEDHSVVRNGIKSLLDNEPGLQVCGEATNGTQVMQHLTGGLVVDIILADMNMPGMSGPDLIKNVTAQFPDILILILSMVDHERHVTQAFKAGASGYLLKNVSSEEMIFAIKQVHMGSKYLCIELSLKLLDKLIYAPEIPDQIDLEFSRREIEILRLIANGHTNQEIADKLYTSKRTVEKHRQSLIDKTNSLNTAMLIKYAVLNGMITV